MGKINMILAIISHTEHYYDKFGNIKGFEPTIREINKLKNIFNIIYHIAPIYNGEPPKNFIHYNHNDIKFVPLRPAGGKSIISKLRIIQYSYHNITVINKICRKVDRIQFRAPTNLGLYVLPYLKWFNKKKYWVKYAGNWGKINQPISYLMQMLWLNYVLKKPIVTINGKWLNQKKHIYTFENPCYSVRELNKASELIKAKCYSEKLEICFVGAMEEYKGVHIVIDALNKSQQSPMIQKFYFVGSGSEEKKIRKSAEKMNQLKIDIKGAVSRKTLNQIYAKCHIIILPSKSEGFPKVIAEAISYGCVPIVSNVGSINQYINESNGVVLNVRSSDELKKQIDYLINNRIRLKRLAQNGLRIAKIFSFERYNKKIKKYILNT
jgi:glycosyltransferase involved in cell wall biosynthesis